MRTSNSRSQIITFYSYKGGTGRSMALANIACLLAERQSVEGGKKILMIDWDLEAPGLHRYFRNRLATKRLSMGSSEDYLDAKPGLIDLFYELDEKLNQYNNTQLSEEATDDETHTPGSEEVGRRIVGDVNLQQYILPTTINGLDLLKAGRFSSKDPNEYSERVNKFNWEALYQKSPHLIRLVIEALAEEYAYVLIDSRTGVTDISGICTMILPEKLVVVFTPNLQSLKGGVDLIKRATDYRKESADLRPLLVFPLVSRVEMSESDLKEVWRFGNLDIPGYQPEFERVLADVYERGKIKLSKYFDEIQIQHIPRYAYGEEVAVLIEKIWDRLSLRRSYETFANKLVEDQAPWEGEIGTQDFVGQRSNVKDRIVGSLSSAGRAVRRNAFALSVPLILLLVLSLFSLAAYAQRQRATAAQQAAQSIDLKLQIARLEQQIAEVQEPLKALEEKDAIINKLYAQVNQSSQDRDKAEQESLMCQAKASAAQRNLQQCQQARGAAEEALNMCKKKYFER